ncbi:HAD family hydrolase [Umezawaea tangerina]|uniref:Beta-phosphoglucomutase n=1 Tax=Umezawaea tangerina TaxID=84725 RepID=A0A2T0THP8_9PSEU|nr:beta-phosphoglucomutase family hydrolase [Umezawaea tangerina]PRY45131.1 HAD superfamily hydrolase (TIGR01509 family)/beta-phosphoglucomutase family hydrolase [Umezawaea tangerina]
MRETVGLPVGITACLFDLDGVLTNTAELHRKAWKATFDEFLRARDGADFRPFTEDDYLRYVDGRLRVDGVRGFLDSRGISLPEDGSDGDSPTAVATRKNDLLEKIITEQGVTPYPGSLRYLEAAERAGLAIGVVTSSANGERVLAAADLSRFVRVRVDGVVIERDGLRGKPAPDAFLAGARGLGVEPAQAAVFEDALSGVEAGRAGGFGHVVGVDRTGQAAALHDHGADVVVADLAELLEPKP